MKRKALPALLLLSLLLALLLPILPRPSDRAIYDNILRLHILARSDSPVDQEIKLRVRDAILTVTESLLSSAEDAEQAEMILGSSLDLLKETADRALHTAGAEDESRVTLCREVYPTRSYGALTLPGGSYTSLKIEIGKGEGENWWCVLFPTLCLASSTADHREAFLDAGFTPDQYRLLTESEKGGYVIRFRLVQWLFGLTEK